MVLIIDSALHYVNGNVILGLENCKALSYLVALGILQFAPAFLELTLI